MMETETNTSPMTLAQIRLAGTYALLQHLGPVGMVRFLQQYESGSGNYSKQRHQWLDNVCVDDLAQQIIDQRT